MSPFPPGQERPVTILVAEPDPDLMLRLQGAMRAISTPTALHHVRTEEDIFDFLRKQGEWSKAPQPDIILLDSGLMQALDRLKSDNPLMGIPVIVMGNDFDRIKARDCHARHCNACLPKPADAAGMRGLAAAIDAFWFKTAVLPPNRDS